MPFFSYDVDVPAGKKKEKDQFYWNAQPFKRIPDQREAQIRDKGKKEQQYGVTLDGNRQGKGKALPTRAQGADMEQSFSWRRKRNGGPQKKDEKIGEGKMFKQRNQRLFARDHKY